MFCVGHQNGVHSLSSINCLNQVCAIVKTYSETYQNLYKSWPISIMQIIYYSNKIFQYITSKLKKVSLDLAWPGQGIWPKSNSNT